MPLLDPRMGIVDISEDHKHREDSGPRIQVPLLRVREIYILCKYCSEYLIHQDEIKSTLFVKNMQNMQICEEYANFKILTKSNTFLMTFSILLNIAKTVGKLLTNVFAGSYLKFDSLLEDVGLFYRVIPKFLIFHKGRRNALHSDSNK